VDEGKPQMNADGEDGGQGRVGAPASAG